MRANGLKAIHTVEESKAVLIKSKHASDPRLVDKVASRIRGVIGNARQLCAVSDADQMGYSCPAICPVSVQYTSGSAQHGHQNNTGEAGTNHHTAGRGGLGRGEQYGREEEDCDSDGRVSKLRRDRHIGPQHRQFTMSSCGQQFPFSSLGFRHRPRSFMPGTPAYHGLLTSRVFPFV